MTQSSILKKRLKETLAFHEIEKENTSKLTSPMPQEYNSPDVVIAAECEEPHAMSRIRFDRNASINFGLSSVMRLLWPNFPSSPSPESQEKK